MILLIKITLIAVGILFFLGMALYLDSE